MESGKDFNITNLLNRTVFCAVLAALPTCSFADDDLTGLMHKGFGSQLSGKSIASLSTLGEAQGNAFRQSITRRQNGLHSFANDIGQSKAFFGEPSEKKDDTGEKVMETIGHLFGFGSGKGGLSPDFWTTKFERRGRVNAAESRDDYEYKLKGFAGGLDTKLGQNWTVGGAGGYSRTSSNFDSFTDTDTAVDAFHSAAYVSYEEDNTSIDGMASFTYLRNASERAIDNNEKAEGQSRGYQMSWSTQAMHHYRSNGFVLTPQTGFTFATQTLQGMTENGAGNLNLSTNGTTTRSLKPTLGIDLARTYQLEPGSTITPEIYGVYSYEVLDSQEAINARLNGNNAFSLDSSSTQLSRHSMLVGAGMRFQIGENLSGKFNIDSDMQPGSHEHRALFKLNATW